MASLHSQLEWEFTLDMNLVWHNQIELIRLRGSVQDLFKDDRLWMILSGLFVIVNLKREVFNIERFMLAIVGPDYRINLVVMRLI